MPLNTPDPTHRWPHERYGSAARKALALRELVRTGLKGRALDDVAAAKRPPPQARISQLFSATGERPNSAPSVKPVHSTAEFTLACPPAQITGSQLLRRKIMTQGSLPSRLLLEELHRRYAHSRSSRP